MIVFACGGCARELRLDDELAGKEVSCPDCRVTCAVPAIALEPRPTPAATPVKRPAARRKSRAQILAGLLALGLVVVTFAGIGVYFLVGFLLPGISSKDWEQFNPPGGNYSVRMPGVPIENKSGLAGVQSARRELPREGTGHAEFAAGKGQKYVLDLPKHKLRFTVAHADAGAAAPDRNLDTVLSAERDQVVKDTSATVLDEGDTQLGTTPGKFFRAETPDGQVIVERVYLAPWGRRWRYYLVAVVSQKDDPAAETFLDSFRIGGEQPMPPPLAKGKPMPGGGKVGQDKDKAGADKGKKR